MLDRPEHPLKTWRRERGLTQAAFAAQCDALAPDDLRITQQTIDRIESGAMPRPALMRVLAQATEGFFDGNRAYGLNG